MSDDKADKPVNMNGSKHGDVKPGWLRLVNLIATVLVSSFGFLFTKIQLGDWVTANALLPYIGILFGMYIILQLPTIVDSFITIYIRYRQQIKLTE
jgi:hypothetical protein